MNDKGRLILFSGPSGVGKDTLLKLLYKNMPSLVQSVSATTRDKRENEINGKDYYFISKNEFENMIQSGNILEYNQYGDNLYGTPKAPIDNWLNDGKTVILKIEVNGAKRIKKMYPDNSVSIFLLPPSIEILENRLKNRNTETDDEIEKRLQIAISEIEQSSEYDYKIYNDDLETAVDEIIKILN